MKKKNNTPRRKRLTRKKRLIQGAKWIKEYRGKKLIRGYSNWFGVDNICAITELKMLGVVIPENVENNVRASIKAITEHRLKVREKSKIENEISFDSDENFAFMAGYTSGGTPYGVTHEDWKALEAIYLDSDERQLYDMEEYFDFDSIDIENLEPGYFQPE